MKLHLISTVLIIYVVLAAAWIAMTGAAAPHFGFY